MKNVQKEFWVINALSFAFICFFACLFIGCGERSESKLIGKWVNKKSSYSKYVFDDLELFKDGIGVNDGHSFNWKVENNRFIITSSSVGFAYNYYVSDSVLILIYKKGDSARYYNYDWLEKRKVEEEKRKVKDVRKTKATMVDERDGKKYKTLKFGKQVWMAENLNYNASGSKCYNDSIANCDKYGRLYDWETAMKVCPSGWHLPSNDEWTTLTNFVGSDAGAKLKSGSGWHENGNGTDNYGFSALPSGIGGSGGSFGDAGNRGNWWTATEGNSDYAYRCGMSYNYEGVGGRSGNKANLTTVRCVRD